VIELDPGHVDAYGNLGAVFSALKQFQKAKNCYEKAKNIDPTNKVNKIGYGKVLLRLNEHAKGLKSINEGHGVIEFTQSDFKII